MPDQSPAVALRVAAQKLRETAAQASPGPWLIEYDYAGITPQAVYRMDPAEPDNVDESIDVGGMEAAADNVWAALMSPAVAEPLAQWLETAAAQADGMWELFIPGTPRFGIVGVDVVSVPEWTEDSRTEAVEGSHLSAALVLARTVLASTP